MANAAVAVRCLVFVVGASSLGVEIAAARLLAPYFGASTVVWACTIATVLLSLSIGYWTGGKLADRRPRLSGMSSMVLSASVLLAGVPFAAGPFLSLAVKSLGTLSLGGLLGSLTGVLGLVALPLILLGAVSPYANRLSLCAVTDAGRTTGRLYALSTVGSLTGTFLAALALIPLIGTHRTFLTFALMLAVVAAPFTGSRLSYFVAVAICALFLAPQQPLATTVAGARIIASVETEYQNARVLELPSGERWLQVNEGLAVQSIYRPWSYLTGDPIDDCLVLPFASIGGVPQRIAILGDAAGSIAREYGYYFPNTRVDAVEIDGALTSLGIRYFDLRGLRLHIYRSDARPWLAASNTHYGAIFLDAWRMPYIPFYLITQEFFESVRIHLQPPGVLVINVGYLPNQGRPLEDVVISTLRSVFPVVMRDRASTTNTLIVAGMEPISADRILRSGGLPHKLRPLATAVARRLAPSRGTGPVYTDDWAPVESLTNLSLLRYMGL